MPYLARGIPLTCDDGPVRDWASFMTSRLDQVRQSLVRDGVRREQWYLLRGADGLALIGVMDVDDPAAVGQAAAASDLAVDVAHRRFKRHWKREGIEDLDIDPTSPPDRPHAECLPDVRP
ncbi:MAG: DUF6176 family protein [Pseudomonadota bacterium]